MRADPPSQGGPAVDHAAAAQQIRLDEIVPEYRSSLWFVRNLFLGRLTAAIRLKPWRAGRVLDAGCGSGLLLERLGKSAPPESLFGVDTNIHVAELPTGDGRTIERADIRELPFADEFFETVYCLDVLEHIEDLDEALREIRRVLLDGGHLIVSIPKENVFYKFCRLLLKGTWSADEGPGAGAHHWTGRPLLAKLRSFFELERVVSLPLREPFALFNIVRLRKRATGAARKVSVVIPAYNESETIEVLLRRVLAAPLGGLEREVIVVDDGSADRTPEILASFESQRVRVLRHERNRGKGAALRTGFEQVSGDVVIVQDADLEYSPEEYLDLLQPILENRAEVVYGSRFQGKDRTHYSSLAFFLGGQIVTAVANLLYGLRLTDEPTCYKMFRSSLLRSLQLECERFEFCPEFTAKVGRRGIPIVEVPISYDPRSVAQGKKITWRDGLEALWTLLRYRFRE